MHEHKPVSEITITPPEEQLFEIEDFEEPAEPAYQVIRGHDLMDGRHFSQEQVLTQYVQLTDQLIQRLEGSYDEPPPDAVLFLDKSARPVSWLVKELWPLLARRPGTDYADKEIPSLPEFKFLNIDREQWAPLLDPHDTGSADLQAIPAEMVSSLRLLFTANAVEKGHVGAYEQPTTLDGKRILIVDEVRSTGRSLQYAMALLSRAIPEADISGTYWMVPGEHTDKAGNKWNNDIPVWYHSQDVYGRGVANRDIEISERSPSRAQRIGKFFLSTRLQHQDVRSTQLRREFKQLAMDVAARKVLYQPSLMRGIDDTTERILAIDGMSLQAYQRERVARERVSAS